MSNKIKNISIVGSVGIPARYGGFETFAESLVSKTDYIVNWTVYCSKRSYLPSERTKTFGNAKLKYLPFSANGIQSLIYDGCSIVQSIAQQDAVFVLGVSGTFVFPIVKLFSKKPIILNPDGLEWRRRKKNFLWRFLLSYLYKIGIKYADYIVSDNDVTARFISRYFNKQSVVIGYGGDTSTIESFINSETPNIETPQNFDLTIARIVPENNIDLILDAYSNFPSRNILVIGNFANSKYGMEMLRKYRGFSNIFLVNPIYDINVVNYIREKADLYIHGHSCGGTNPSLVEAMFHKKCIVAYNILFNKVVTDFQARYFKNQNDLIELLIDINSDQIESIGDRMHEIALAKYTWDNVADQYSELFNKVLN